MAKAFGSVATVMDDGMSDDGQDRAKRLVARRRLASNRARDGREGEDDFVGLATRADSGV